MLFLPSDFGKNCPSRIYREIQTKDDAIEASLSAYAFCKENGIDEKRSYYASLFVEELGMNIVTYGFSDKEQSAAIYLSASESGELTIRFRDDGKRFDLTKWCTLFNGHEKSAHIGIRMVASLAHNITYTNSFNTNNVTIKLSDHGRGV